MGIWNFEIPQRNEEKWAEFKRLRSIRMDDIIRVSIPRCTITPQSFEIDTEAELTLTNVSCAVVVWRVLRCPDSVTLVPAQGLLMPLQAEICKVTLTGAVDGIQIVMLEIEGGGPVTFELWRKS
jgi:hypothetical protein